MERVTIQVSTINSRIVRKALARNKFYTFRNLKTHIGKLQSIQEFIESDVHLGKIEIEYVSSKGNIEALKA